MDLDTEPEPDLHDDTEETVAMSKVATKELRLKEDFQKKIGFILKQFQESKSNLNSKQKTDTDSQTIPNTKTNEYLSNGEVDLKVSPRTTTTTEQIQIEVEKTWKKFCTKHQISPSHTNTNNNVNIEKRLKDNNGTDSGLEVKWRKTETKKIRKTIKFENGIRPDSKDSKTTEKNRSRFGSVQIVIGIFRIFKMLLQAVGLTVLLMAIFSCLIALHKPTQAFISRNTQDLIYPFMRALRIMSLPVVMRFPYLTDFYEESCLLANPFYEIDELDCWPCESVRHVIDLTGFTNFSAEYHHSGIPFIVKDAFTTEIGIDDIRDIYRESIDSIGKAFVETNRARLTTLDNVFSPQENEVLNSPEFHLKWHINRVTTARLWRKYFPRPYFIPLSTEISVQHFLFVDQTASRTYKLPVTEFANVFLTQASGSRSVVLIPTENCQQRCKVVSAILQPKDVLFYNWLFWRPMSVPSDSSPAGSTSVTFLGSFY